jgi:hypothetical protein
MNVAEILVIITIVVAGVRRGWGVEIAFIVRRAAHDGGALAHRR